MDLEDPDDLTAPTGQGSALWAALFALIRQRAGVDFRDHRRNVLVKGLRSRMAATRSVDLEGYLRTLAKDADEIDRLVEALVLRVSSFFREREVFEAIGRVVLPDQRLRARGAPVRLWAAGVATGQEAWSLAMLLAQMRDTAPQQVLTLLATDVDEGSLAVAREGRYPAGMAAEVPPDLRARFLRAQGTEVVVTDDLRELVTFTRHDLMGTTLAPAEAVLASFHVIVVRNVLLYFDQRLREKAFERLSAVIKPGGALVLGGFESIPDSAQGKFHPYPDVPENLQIFQSSVL
jgi:two-component system, chemotaxis family, CheB/CheR fusion protein